MFRAEDTLLYNIVHKKVNNGKNMVIRKMFKIKQYIDLYMEKLVMMNDKKF